jgi:dCTP deaminase
MFRNGCSGDAVFICPTIVAIEDAIAVLSYATIETVADAVGVAAAVGIYRTHHRNSVHLPDNDCFANSDCNRLSACAYENRTHNNNRENRSRDSTHAHDCPSDLNTAALWTATFYLPPASSTYMILSDADILDRMEAGDLVVEPLDDPDLQIQPASVDLRLGREFLEFQRTNIPCIHPDSEQEVSEYVTETRVEEGEEFILHPGDFVLGTTKERVEIPADLIAHVEGRSSFGRLAVVIHATAGVVDPGYCGQITLELSNLGTAPVALTPDTRISQLIFTELKQSADRPYGSDRGSKYQDQSGPQASRIGGDEEFGGDQIESEIGDSQ